MQKKSRFGTRSLGETIIKSKRQVLLQWMTAMIDSVYFIKTQTESSKANFSKKISITD
jgi:hypothetical protein